MLIKTYIPKKEIPKLDLGFGCTLKTHVGVYPYLTSSNPQKLFQGFLLIRPYREVLPWANIQVEMEEVERVICDLLIIRGKW